MALAVSMKRTPASTIMTTPMAIKARPAKLANIWPCGAICFSANCGAATQKQVELLDHETKRHDRDGGADPGEKRSLVGGVVAVALDHDDCLDWPAPDYNAGLVKSHRRKHCALPPAHKEASLALQSSRDCKSGA